MKDEESLIQLLDQSNRPWLVYSEIPNPSPNQAQIFTGKPDILYFMTQETGGGIALTSVPIQAGVFLDNLSSETRSVIQQVFVSA